MKTKIFVPLKPINMTVIFVGEEMTKSERRTFLSHREKPIDSEKRRAREKFITLDGLFFFFFDSCTGSSFLQSTPVNLE